MIKKYKKELTKEEIKKRKYKDRKLINSYDVGFEGIEELLEIEIEENYYDEYEICYFYDGKIKKLRTKKIKAKTEGKELIKLSTKIKKCGEYLVYGRKINKLIVIEAILGIFLLLSTAGYAYSNIPAVKNTIEDFLIEKVKVDTPTSPVISGGSEIWNKERIIKIEKDAKSGSGIKYYEYCVSSKKDMKNCRYKITTTKNAVINKTGKYYIAFRGVSNKGTKGKLSNIEYIAIDNEIPEINNVEIKEEIGKLKVKIDATDKLSGIGKILYQIDGETEKETTNEFELEITGEHILTIIVRDKVGNEVRISKNINISVKINDEQTPGEKNNEQNNNEETKNNDSENKNEENNTPGASEDENDNKKAPIINLNKVPKRIKIKDNYDLPSYYEFDKQGGEVRCELEDKTEVTNTKELELGNHTITCEAKGNNGLTTSTSKEIEVTTEENITWDGWMTLTLYYPENSTDWEYRVANENDVRDKESSWKEYTGPILIRLSQVDDVYIRYKLGGKTYIVNPKGKITVDIEPQSYEVGENQSTKITITYDENAKIKEYRIDGGEWTKYEKPFNIKGNTLIEARAIKEEKVYDSDGTYQYTTKRQGTDSVYIKRISNEITPGGTTPGGSTTNPDLPSNPEIDNIPGGNTTEKPMLSPTYLEGPTITNKQENEIVEETEVEITTKEKASKIYYSIGYGKYEEYKETLKVKENQVIRAYYIRESDGKRSDTSYYYVKNIKRPSYPYVKIDVEPSNYLDTIVTEAAVKISGQNYKKLEYSFDGNIWYTYENPLEIKESKTVYARAIDENLNIDLASTTITTIKPPKVYDKYEVSIHTNPKKEEVKGLINKTEITIDYDSRATKKYYKIGYYGELKEYNGSFTLDKNETIYAYAISDTGNGEAKLNINYLTTGISAPIINQNPEETSNSVKISIEYAKNAETKKYKINNGEWVDYTDEITINENCTIYAMNEDVLGNTNISSKRIKNIAYIPNYTLIDKGNYYIIHLNYPDSSNSDNREYKWTKNGKWKKYNNSLGILLIKQEGKNIISKDGVKIEDEKGKEIIYTDHYYLIDDISDNLMENLFMRWDTSKPAKPTFILSEEEPTKELEVAIIYDNTSKIKQYKIIKPTGEDSGWLDYNGPIKITDNKTVIYAKSQNSAEVWSETSNIKITNIDDEAPQIEARGELEKPRQKVTVQLVGKDNLGIDKVGYAKNNVDCSKATYIENMQTFTVEENGLYTICAKDKVGNTAKDLIEIKNIDKTAPDIAINILTKDYGNTLEFEIDYKDSKTKQYKIGNEEYKNYIGKVKIKSEDVLSQKNEDGSLTIYAKGIDEASNEKEVEETTYLIDLDAPKLPVINSGSLYPILKQNEILYDDYYYIEYDKRDDIENYISLDDGKTWKEYTGSGHYHKGKIQAKSVKKDSGLTVVSEKDMSLPSDALGESAYDDHEDTIEKIEKGIKKIIIDESLRKKELNILGNAYIAGANQELSIEFYDENDTLLEKYAITSASKATIELSDSYTIPASAKYLVFRSNDNTSTYFEIKELVISKKETISGESILSILQNNNLETGYYNFEVADEIYGIHLYSYEGNQVINENTQYGDIKDIGKSNSYAKNMVIVKVNGDLTINEGVTVGPYYTAYGGPKGFTLYVTGKLTNNGTINNSHGAKAEGQNVYLWKNADGTYEYVPKEGAKGGAKTTGANNGIAGTGRQTGGGGTGRGYSGTAGAGATGTSYSGGSGSGSGYAGTSTDAIANGGAGSNGTRSDIGSGGAGNPGGSGYKAGANGTGGLLIIYADDYENNGTLNVNGSMGGTGNAGGGGSGAGSINIFTNAKTNIDKLGVITNTKYTEMLGKYSCAGGYYKTLYPPGAGGTGTINIGSIRNNQYYDLKEIIEQDKESYKNSIKIEGESILSILQNNDLKSGYWYFKVNDEEYSVHLYVLDGNQTFSENQTFGDANDVATATDYARNMVIVKVNGDLTINEGVTVGPYYTAYGGPKGFTLYVTGKLTNNGTINNSHGAKAEGQNVYLWKNADGTYEYVPKEGAKGGAKTTGANNGIAGTGRQTGGGGTGRGYSGTAGAGATGTSYSGGSGSGSGYAGTSTDAIANGGAGSNGTRSDIGSGGAGNPGGSGYKAGANGTGGLLIIYADDYENNGTLNVNGSMGGTGNAGGGGSGAGSINIFTNAKTNIDKLGVITNTKYTEMLGKYSCAGGYYKTLYPPGAGGTGTINIGSIRNGQYYDLKEIIEQDKKTYEEQSTQKSTTISKPIKVISTPTFDINNLSTGEKEVSINYPQGYTNEYSVDSGQTWNLYTDKIKVTENLTIFARIIDSNNQVITSSTIKITSIEVNNSSLEEENINDNTIESEDNNSKIKLDIPNEILVGESYKLPTSDNGICKINEEIVEDTSKLNSGNYEIKCYNNEELVLTKNIIIKEKE